MEVRPYLKLIINQSLEIKETEITINCSVLDDRLKRLVENIRQYSFSLKGFSEGHNYNIPLEEIFYIDSVDGKTFLYCNDKVCECKETLASIEQMLLHTPFVRISKNCILNINVLKCVKSSLNHRMEATLRSGEKLMISRNYIENIKKKLES
jgi:DNA-binding LytR/AlgR family response regulator